MPDIISDEKAKIHNKGLEKLNSAIKDFIKDIRSCRKDCRDTCKEIGELNERIKE